MTSRSSSPTRTCCAAASEIAAYYDLMWDTWSGYSWKPCEVVQLGEDRYAMVARIDGEGRGSGATAGTEATIFYTLVDGLIAQAEFEPGRSPQLQE